MTESYVLDESESARVLSLAGYQILESLPEKEFDTIARLASYICRKPISTIAFLDSENHHIKSHVGIGRDISLRKNSLDQFVILEANMVEIDDASVDVRTANLPGVIGRPRIRFFAGAPIFSSEGYVLGVLSVMDTSPGELDADQREALSDLADQARFLLEARKKSFHLDEIALAHEELNTMFSCSVELQAIMDRNGTILRVNNAVERMLGYTPDEGKGIPIWEFFLEEDIVKMIPGIEAGLTSGQKKFEVEARIRLKDNSTKWMGWTVMAKKDKWYVNGRDISEQKKMIAELEQLSLIADNVNNGVIISDSEGLVIWANDTIQSITGYSLDDIKGQNLGDVISGAKSDREVLKKRDNSQSKLPFSVDFYAYRKDGMPIWLSILNSVILDANGNVYKEVQVITDITARKKVEEDLETLSMVASKSSSGVVIRDGKGRVTWVNSAIEKILGYNLSELQGKLLSEVVAGEETDRSVLEHSRQALKNKKAYRIDLLVYKKDGTPIWLHSSTTPILNEAGQIERQVEIINDITERKNAEEQLTLLSLVASKTVNGVAISSSDGKIKWVNQALEKLTGYTLEEFKNTRPGDLLAGEGTDMELLKTARKQAVNCVPSNLELLSYKKDGTPIWLAISNTPTFNKDGSLDQQVEIINDISERKLAEQELIKTREEALQLSKAKETFLSVMSHEIRTPLNAVIGMSHILADDDPTPSQLENLKILRFSAQNLMSLINDILDFTKIETGNLVLESVNVNLKDLVSQTLNSLQFKTTEKLIALKSEIDHRIPTYVMGDNTRLYQILINLLGNSVKFTENGEVKLKLDLVNENKKSVKVRFEISDTGIGIEPEKIDYIFDSYTQASSDTTRKYGGTGLGLAITKSLLKLHNSNIEVESEVGKGSKFSFVIDFNRSQQSDMKVESPTPVEKIDASILVVDDNEINRILASKVLSKWGIEVTFAENGQIALDKVQEFNFDLVLMDLHMPVMDGMEASKAIRKLGGKYTKLPIVALTASLFAHELETIKECGMDGFVMKPFVPNDLYTKIISLISPK